MTAPATTTPQALRFAAMTWPDEIAVVDEARARSGAKATTDDEVRGLDIYHPSGPSLSSLRADAERARADAERGRGVPDRDALEGHEDERGALERAHRQLRWRRASRGSAGAPGWRFRHAAPAS